MDRELDSMMQVDHVVRVWPGGRVTDPTCSVYAPEANLEVDDDGISVLKEHETALIESIRAQGWELQTGWSGQSGSGVRYRGPGMHRDEYIGGNLEEHIRSTPGYWVVITPSLIMPERECPYDEKSCSTEDPCSQCTEDAQYEGWMLAFREATNVIDYPISDNARMLLGYGLAPEDYAILTRESGSTGPFELSECVKPSSRAFRGADQAVADGKEAITVHVQDGTVLYDTARDNEEN
jgi:hypothetical protein